MARRRHHRRRRNPMKDWLPVAIGVGMGAGITFLYLKNLPSSTTASLPATTTTG